MFTRRKLLAIVGALAVYSAAAALVAAPIDQIYWNVRYWFTNSPTPSDIVVVTIDQAADQPDRNADRDALILQKLRNHAPRSVYLDDNIRKGSPALVKELREWNGTAYLVTRLDPAVRPANTDLDKIALPAAGLVGATNIVASGFEPNFWKYAESTPCSFTIRGQRYQAFADSLAGNRCRGGDIRPDFSMDPDAVLSISADDLISGNVANARIRDKHVVVSVLSGSPGNKMGYFGHGQQPRVVLDIAAAMGAGPRPFRDAGSELLLVLFVVTGMMGMRIRAQRVRWSVYALTVLTVIAGPAALERVGFLAAPGSAIVAMVMYGGWRLWSRWRLKVIQTGHSGLPNFVALANRKVSQGSVLVVAVIARYEEFLATLPENLHGECARQIARRFSVGCDTGEIYHGEGGHFAWIERDRDTDDQTAHYEGMRALFSAPLLVGGHMFDTNVHFGIDRNAQLDTLTRLNTALASATEALNSGKTLEQFEAKRLANAPWELSLLARIDEGMRNGDIWLAYQPQWDYPEGRISGAEALIRWNDPVRGSIRPDEFILQAERAGRIDALTYWVLEHAISAAEAFNALGPRFQVSINLSAQLVDKPSLVSVTEEIVRRRGIDCTLLTVEVTETASVYNRPAAIRNLQQLRAMGFRLSIDDFGTGEASLCYLSDLPSDELKLDRRFVSRIVTNERDRQIVHSTINLAHSLGQSVVAEGIEDMATFDMLRRMGCDVGQGYYIGRPETFEQLRARYMSIGPHGGKSLTTC